jgi:hypothetical protein
MEALWVAACPDEANKFFAFLAYSVGSGLQRDADLQIMFGIGAQGNGSSRISVSPESKTALSRRRAGEPRHERSIPRAAPALSGEATIGRSADRLATNPALASATTGTSPSAHGVLTPS